VVSTEFLVISPTTVYNSSTKGVRGYVNKYATPIYMNPHSMIVYSQLVYGTQVRGTYRVRGRRYIYTKTPQGKWAGRGWVAGEHFGQTAPLEIQKKPDVTLARFIWTRMRMATNGKEEQQDPGLGFSKFLLPGILYNAYNMEPYYICPGTPYWFPGKQEQFGQPIVVSYSPAYQSIQTLLTLTLRSHAVEGIHVRRSQCTNGTTSHVMRKTSPLNKPPPCFVVSVQRLELSHSPDTQVEELPVSPSKSISIFGKRYKLVSMSIKTGTQSRGHWMACVNTTTGWYRMDDSKVTSVPDITKVRNGVQFIYEEEDVPLLAIDKQGLENKTWRCWANTFTQMVRYSPTFAATIGITDRLPSFNDLWCLVDRTA
jgi:hypothetical protein